jgi:Fe-S-cluster containining protein
MHGATALIERGWTSRVNHNLEPISLDESFCFACSPEVPCFNECCRDLNQFLTPYDILRLKNHLKLSSENFLQRYTSQHIGPETGLPIITLRANNTDQLRCPFVTSTGCEVYEDRPSSCRTYPLIRTLTRSRESGKINEHFMVLREPHCLGFNNGKTQTVREWIIAQDVVIYNQINDKMMEIIRLKNRLLPGPPDIKSRHFLYTALYDLDNFRTQIINDGFPESFQLEAGSLDAAVENDVALLELGMKWVKHMLFRHE